MRLNATNRFAEMRAPLALRLLQGATKGWPRGVCGQNLIPKREVRFSSTQQIHVRKCAPHWPSVCCQVQRRIGQWGFVATTTFRNARSDALQRNKSMCANARPIRPPFVTRSREGVANGGLWPEPHSETRGQMRLDASNRCAQMRSPLALPSLHSAGKWGPMGICGQNLIPKRDVRCASTQQIDVRK